MIRSVPKRWAGKIRACTQLVRGRCPAGRQDGPNHHTFVTYVVSRYKIGTGCGSPALSPNYFG